MKVINMGETPSVLGNYIAELRDADIQKDSLRFRANLERVGAVFAYEISKTLSYSGKEVKTPLGVAQVPTLDSQVVIAAILRAGLPLQAGLLQVFDHAECAFLSAYRKYGKGGYCEIRADYCTSPSVEGKVLILADALVATGASIEMGLQNLTDEGGTPEKVHLVCPIASRSAVDHLCQSLDSRYTMWVGAIDEELTSRSYVIPGMGDAGDLAFGCKR